MNPETFSRLVGKHEPNCSMNWRHKVTASLKGWNGKCGGVGATTDYPKQIEPAIPVILFLEPGSNLFEVCRVWI